MNDIFESAIPANARNGSATRFNKDGVGGLDRLPPHSDEAERGVLGCCIISPLECVPITIATLNAQEEAFYDLRHQIIFTALMRLSEKNRQIDIITLQQRLSDLGSLEEIGGMPYLNSLQDGVPSASNLPVYLEIVSEKYLLRKAVRVCQEAIGRIYNSEGEAIPLIDQLEKDILAIRTLRGSANTTGIREVVGEAMREVQQKRDSGGNISGLSTGFSDIDRYTDGLHPGDMTVIAAYPSVGKTALAMNIAENAVIQSQVPVGVFSLEMTSVALAKRCICSMSRINIRSVTSGVLPDSEFERMKASARKLAEAKLYIDDTSDLSISALRAKARRMWQQFGIQLFVIDYLQLMNAIGAARKTENRQQEVADISNGIKSMAKELRVPIIVLSQLNDDGKLRESRAIGQDADGVWMLEENERGHTLWIRKQRNGPRNVGIQLAFLADYTRFESAAKVSDEDVPQNYEPSTQDML